MLYANNISIELGKNGRKEERNKQFGWFLLPSHRHKTHLPSFFFLSSSFFLQKIIFWLKIDHELQNQIYMITLLDRIILCTPWWKVYYKGRCTIKEAIILSENKEEIKVTRKHCPTDFLLIRQHELKRAQAWELKGFVQILVSLPLGCVTLSMLLNLTKPHKAVARIKWNKT